MHSPEAKAVNAISLDPAPFTDDMVHESAKHALEQRKKYARWLDADDAVVVANAMLIIIGRALNMLKSQIEAQGKAFEETGGFSERLTAKRIEAREPGQRRPRPTARSAASPCAGASRPRAISGAAPPFPTAKAPGRYKSRTDGFRSGYRKDPKRMRGDAESGPTLAAASGYDGYASFFGASQGFLERSEVLLSCHRNRL